MREVGETGWVLGLGGSSHDYSAALMYGIDIKVAIEEERLSRKKHSIPWWFENPVARSVAYCLADRGIGLDAVEAVVSSDLLPNKVVDHFSRLGKQVIRFNHHRCHAASAAILAPFSARTLIIVADGMGAILDGKAGWHRRETVSFFESINGSLRHLGTCDGLSREERHVDFPADCSNSLGILYELVTVLIGYDCFETGKTMGLAAHGVDRYRDVFERHIRLGETIENCFQCDPDMGLLDEVSAILDRASHSFEVRADMAASLQAVIDRAFVHFARTVGAEDYDIVCVVGGCGLNSVANGQLAAALPPPTSLIVPPWAGDAGLALGAMRLWSEQVGTRREMTFNGMPCMPAASRPGKMYSDAEVRSAILSHYPQLARDASVDGPVALASLLAQGMVVGLFHGRSEIGPRALGGRSILGDPRRAETREHINRSVKHREPFRPLAPMILASAYDDWFQDARQADRFMLKVAHVTDKCRQLAPAIVHQDGTARVQCIDEGSPFLFELLSAFYAETGVPILLNTSFNRRGEPIVESPDEAVSAFLDLGLDGIFIADQYYWRPGSTASK